MMALLSTGLGMSRRFSLNISLRMSLPITLPMALRMARRSALLAGLAAAVAPLAGAATVADCTAMPVPTAASVQSVAQEMVVNGVPMSIRAMNTKQSPQQVLEFYRRAWPARGGRAGNIEYRLAPWDVIAAKQDACFYSVQVQAGPGGSIALLGVSRVDGASQAAAPGAGFPQMAGTKVANDYRSNDSGKAARLLVLRNVYSSTGNAGFYRDQMARAGWSLVQESRPTAADTQAVVLVFRRGASWADVSISAAAGATEVVVNINE